VECVGGNIEEDGDDEIFLVSDIYPDVFLNLTNTPGSDRNPSWPDQCGPGMDSKLLGSTAPEDAEFIIGYEDADGVMTSNQKTDLVQACRELPIACVEDNFDALIEQNVDAIISFSNKWHVMGSSPQIYNATGNDIPVIVLNAESDASGSYNLSNGSAYIRSSLEWMFNEMDGTGDFVYFVSGQNAFHQSVVDEVLAEYPGISATGIQAEFGDDSVTSGNIAELIGENPGLGAIWSDENVQELLIAVKGVEEGQPPLIVCDPREDWLGMWQETTETNPLFQCYATINPGGTAYEGVYVAYYLLSGEEIKPDALGGLFGNTLLYDYPVITNDNLRDYLEKPDEFRTDDWGAYELPPMTPEQIKEAWFAH
jgi:ABC-type sugar transport system substrate-binding protein